MISVDFDIRSRESDIRVAERGEKVPNKGWTIIALVEGASDANFHLRATDDMEDDGPHVTVEMNFYHAENEETGRAFHANAEMPLTRSDLVKLRQVIEMALAILPPDEAA